MPQSNSEPDVRLLICREGRCMLMLPRFMYKPLSCLNDKGFSDYFIDIS